jgi:hypothetical protein
MMLKGWRKLFALILAACLLLAACSRATPPAARATPPASGGEGMAATQAPASKPATSPASSGEGMAATRSPASKPATPGALPPVVTPGEAGQTAAEQPTLLPGSLPFTLIQAGAPTDGDPQPLFVALRGEGTGQQTPPGLPTEARQALEAALAERQAGLILVLYAGEMPSGGFSLQIEALAAGPETLTVTYALRPPDPQAGATTVLTYPYLIARVDSAVAPEGVQFEKAK